MGIYRIALFSKILMVAVIIIIIIIECFNRITYQYMYKIYCYH